MGLIDSENKALFNTALDVSANAKPLTHRKWHTGNEPGRDLSIVDGIGLEVRVHVNFPARAAKRGVPMLADAHGRVLAETHTRGPSRFPTAVADVPAGTGPTFSARLGDWFAWLSTGLVRVALAGLRKSRDDSPITKAPSGLS